MKVTSKNVTDELGNSTSNQSVAIPLSLTPSEIKRLISPFQQLPTCLIPPILLNLNFLHIFIFAKTSKYFYRLVREDKHLANKEKIIQKIIGELPYLENIYPKLDFEPTFNFFDYGRILIQAFNIYSTIIDEPKDKINSRNGGAIDLRAIFSRFLDLGNPGAAMHLLIKKLHPELLLTYRSYNGTNIAVEISKNLPKIEIAIDVTGHDRESKTHGKVKTEIKPDRLPSEKIKLFSDYLSYELEIKNSHNKYIKNQSLQTVQSSYQSLADRLFDEMTRITFPNYEIIKGEEFFADRPSGTQIAKNIILDLFRIINSIPRNHDILIKSVGNTLVLFVISYACHQLKIIEIIQKTFLTTEKCKFISTQPMLYTLAKYCIRYGQVELMNFLFSLPGAPSPDKMIAHHVSGIIESQDIPMLKLLNLYKIKLANHSGSDPQVSAIKSLIYANKPYLTLEMMRGEVLMSSIGFDLQNKILLQFSLLSLDKINFLLTKWENELSNSNHLIQNYKKELFYFIVNYIMLKYENQDFVIALIGNRFSKDSVYRPGSPSYVYNNKTLIQIVEKAKLEKVASFLKGKTNSASISSLSPPASILLNRKRRLGNSVSSFTPTNR